MKILFLTRLFYPHVGGVEKHVLEISKRLVASGHEVTIVTTKYDEGVHFHESIHESEVIRFKLPKIKYLGLIYTWFWFLKNVSLIYKSDIIHCHDVFIWYLPFRFLFPFKPIFTTFHGWEGIYPIPSNFIIHKKIASAFSNKTIAVGNYIENYYKIKCDLITYGATQIIKENFKKDKNSLLYLGRLDLDTGLPTLLESLKRFNDIYHFNGLKVTFCGGGPLAFECKKFGKVLGFVDPRPYLEKANICFASGYLTILEALSYKCLVVTAYDNPLKRDYYKLSPFTKWIFVSDDPNEIAKRIEFYRKDSKAKEKTVSEGYNWVKEQTWEKLTKEYLLIWKAK